MKKALILILHILGFPAMLAVITFISFPIIQEAFASYNIMTLVGLIFGVAMALIYYISFIFIMKSKKKTKFKQTISLILVIFITLCGIWMVIDIALPNFLAGATSKTIYYEEIADDYLARAAVNKALLDEYIRRNFMNGNYDGTYRSSLSDADAALLASVQSKGMKDARIAELLTIHFASIDQNGYATFIHPWIDMATSDRLTIPSLIHLLLDERTIDDTDLKEFALYDRASKEILDDPVKWNVLDMLGEPMEMDLFVLQEMGISEVVNKVGNNLGGLTKSVTGSPITVSCNGATLTLIPSNEARGVLDYQSMAWLNSNGLIYAIVTLMVCRKFFFIFGAWMIFTNFAIGMLRGMTKEEKNAGPKKNKDYEGSGAQMGNPYGGFGGYGGGAQQPYGGYGGYPQYPQQPYQQPYPQQPYNPYYR